MTLTPGMRLSSQVCTTEVIVVRAATVRLSCGGAPMLRRGEQPRDDIRPDPDQRTGNQLGKRYTDGSGRLELLVTKGGEGTLAAEGVPLTIKEARPLPSSD